MKKQVTVNLPNNFEKGNCLECPFHYVEWQEYDNDGYIEMEEIDQCVFAYNFDKCKLDVVNVISMEK